MDGAAGQEPRNQGATAVSVKRAYPENNPVRLISPAFRPSTGESRGLNSEAPQLDFDDRVDDFVDAVRTGVAASMPMLMPA